MNVATMEAPAWTDDHAAAHAACEETRPHNSPSWAMPELKPYAGRPEDLVFELAGNGRVARCTVRPGMKRGQYLGLMFQRWGNGHWCICEGQPAHYSDEADARLAALRWLEAGK